MDIDVRKMEWIAKASSDGEGYLVLERGENFRIGLAARKDPEGVRYSIEFLIHISTDLDRIARSLTGMGYSLRLEADGWLCAEKEIDPGIVSVEMDPLREFVKRTDLG